jgi:membrane protein YdbS with pleckstrin-like domain
VADLSKYLLRTERQIFAVHRHWAFLAFSALMLAIYLVSGIAAMWLFDRFGFLRLIALCFIVVSLAWFLWEVLDWYVERFVVTNRRVLLITGVLTRRVAIMPLIKVTDLTYEQTLTGRTLNYGTFVFESAGQEQGLNRIEFLPDPNRHYHEVSQLLFGTQADVDPDDVLLSTTTQPVPYVRPEP